MSGDSVVGASQPTGGPFGRINAGDGSRLIACFREHFTQSAVGALVQHLSSFSSY